LHDKTGETCGIVSMPMWPATLVSALVWMKSGESLNDTIDAFTATVDLNFEDGIKLGNRGAVTA